MHNIIFACFETGYLGTQFILSDVWLYLIYSFSVIGFLASTVWILKRLFQRRINGV